MSIIGDNNSFQKHLKMDWAIFKPVCQSPGIVMIVSETSLNLSMRIDDSSRFGSLPRAVEKKELMHSMVFLSPKM